MKYQLAQRGPIIFNYFESIQMIYKKAWRILKQTISCKQFFL